MPFSAINFINLFMIWMIISKIVTKLLKIIKVILISLNKSFYLIHKLPFIVFPYNLEFNLLNAQPVSLLIDSNISNYRSSIVRIV